ncbi:MAG: hypothetical protein AB1553_15450 [Nitrospirota bacterium]
MKDFLSIAHYVLAIALVLYGAVAFIRKTRTTKRQRMLDEVMESVHRTGKVLYRDTVYNVREVCDSSHIDQKSYRVVKHLIVSKPGEEKIYKLSIAEVQPYPLRDQ